MKQLNDRFVFETNSRNDLTEQEKKRSMESLILIVQKRYSKIKSRTVANGSMKEHISTVTTHQVQRQQAMR